MRARLWYALDCPPVGTARRRILAVQTRRLWWRVRRQLISPVTFERWARRFPR